MNLARFQSAPIIGILRGFSTEQSLRAIAAATRGGLKAIEITWNSPDAAAQIREASARFEATCDIGAGTILTPKDLDAALQAGASFIVTPVIRREVIEECVRRKVPIFPGAYSPTEVQSAWALGATMVKIFPAETLGPGYLRALHGPFPQIKLLPTGGVDLQTLTAFRKAGAAGFGIGSPLFDSARIEAADWPWLETRARAFTTAVSSHKES